MTTPSSPAGESISVSVAESVHGNLLVGTGNQVTTVLDADALLGPPSSVMLAVPLWNVPTLPARVFVGREAALAELDAVVVAGSATVAQTVFGMGGVGKTELVLHYAYQHRARYHLVWWITAEAPDRIDAGLAALTVQVAALVGKVPPAVTAEAVGWAVGYLNAHPGWLLVLDNVEDRSHVEGLLGRLSGGRVLLTSRRDLDWDQLVDGCIRLDLLTPDAAVDLLVARGHGDDPVSARVLAAELGWLPLALTQAAAYLAQTKTPMADYLDRLRAQPATTLATGAPGTAQATIARVWDLGLAVVSATDPVAIEVLQVLACLAPDNVPRTVLAALAGDVAGDMGSALGVLASYSMVTLTATTVSTHRLVQAVVADQARTVGVWPVIVTRALTAIDQARPTGNPQTATAGWPRWAALLPHIDALAQHFPDGTTDLALARILGETGLYLSSQGAHSAAFTAERRSLAISEAALGPDHPAVALRLDNLAGSLRALGRAGEALPLQERALAITETVHGPDHPAVATRLNNLASSFQNLGRAGEAVPLQKRALAITEAALGPDHPTVATRLAGLAFSLWALGRAGEALPLEQRALAISEAALGPNHPDVATVLDNLAGSLHALGRVEEALPLQERALAISEAALGPDHPDVATGLDNLAGSLRALGRAGEALPLRERALAISEAALGPEHPAVATRLNNLAMSFHDLGRVSEAVLLQERALAITEAAYGRDHPAVATRLNNLASSFRALGRAGEAVPLQERALAITETVYGPDHPDVALRLHNLGLSLWDLDRGDEAERCSRRAVSIADTRLGTDHPTTRTLRATLDQIEAAR